MLKVGNILKFYEEKQTEKIEYQAQVVSIDEDCFYIDYPVNIQLNKIAYLLDHTNIVITNIENESRNKQWKTSVVGRLNTPHPQLIILRPDKEKNFTDDVLQVNTNIDIALHLNNEKQKVVGKTVNLSARKCTVVLNEEIIINQGDFGEIYLVLPMNNGTYQYLKMNCKIDLMERKNNFVYVTILFMNNSFCERELIHFCFEKELEYRKKTLESL